MNDSELKPALARLKDYVVVPATPTSTGPPDEAKRSLADENDVFAKDRHDRDMRDRDDARDQRRKYAKWVFILVCVWIVAIFILLLLQGFGTCLTPLYRPLTEKVLIALIASTTAKSDRHSHHCAQVHLSDFRPELNEPLPGWH